MILKTIAFLVKTVYPVHAGIETLRSHNDNRVAPLLKYFIMMQIISLAECTLTYLLDWSLIHVLFIALYASMVRDDFALSTWVFDSVLVEWPSAHLQKALDLLTTIENNVSSVFASAMVVVDPIRNLAVQKIKELVATYVLKENYSAGVNARQNANVNPNRQSQQPTTTAHKSNQDVR